MATERANELHRPRCCDAPQPEAMWGLGRGDNNFVTIVCTACDTDLVTLDPPAGGDRGVYVGPWDTSRSEVDG